MVDGYDNKQSAISSDVLCDRYRDANIAKEEAAAVSLAPRYTPLVSRGLQFTPTAQTHFKSSDHPIAYFEVYEPLPGGQPKPEAKTHVRIVNARTGETRFHFYPADSANHARPGGRQRASFRRRSEYRQAAARRLSRRGPGDRFSGSHNSSSHRQFQHPVLNAKEFVHDYHLAVLCRPLIAESIGDGGVSGNQC